MNHRLPSLWYPEASCAQHTSSGAEEGGRGPTVVVPQSQHSPATSSSTSQPKSTQEAGTQSQKLETYDTLEKVEEVTLLDLSPLPYQFSKQDKIPPSKKYPNWFCGWTDEEYFDLHRNTTTRSPPREGGRLHTSSVNIRSTIYSRSSFQSTVRRRPPYKFQHFTSYEEYAEEYRHEYSYTSTFVPRQRVTREQETKEVSYKVANERASIALPVEIKNVYQEDPYFAELVNRLGIKEPPRSRGGVIDRDPHLLQGLRPTPPSIVKKKRNVENIVVANSGKS